MQLMEMKIVALKDSFGDRMKCYENVSRNYLTRRVPVIIRLDGKTFHAVTKGFQKPFDEILSATMQETMKYLCKNIQGCVLGYTQSDEITLVLTDYAKPDTDAWFDYSAQKMCSVAASMATYAFNNAFDTLSKAWRNSHFLDSSAETTFRWNAYQKALTKGAFFDARCFNIPKEEVTNCVRWRQADAERNSVESVGHANFSQNQLHKKSCNEIQDMLMTEKGINWNDFPTKFKRGSCCIKTPVELVGKDGEKIIRNRWTIDDEIPIFTGEGREYIESLI